MHHKISDTSFVRSFVRRDVDAKISKMIVRVAAIDPVQFSSKSELSSRFFGRLKIRSVGREKLGQIVKIFKRLKNREDGSDFDDFWTV